MRPNHWAQQFLELATAQGVTAVPANCVNGWIESALIKGRRCFLKSMTYNDSKALYFIGVDPKKLGQTEHAVILWCGAGRDLRDVLVIPWRPFISILSKAAPVNTYADRTYFQYKAHLLDHGRGWELRVQGGKRPAAPAGAWRYTPSAAVAAI